MIIHRPADEARPWLLRSRAEEAEYGESRLDLAILEAALAPENDADANAELDGTTRLAVIGRPNVGKSSLVNRFLGAERVIVSEHAFIAYKLIATLFGARTIETPSPDYEHDLEAMLNAITAKTRIIFIANPNNPTGTLISQIKLAKFISRLPENIVAVFGTPW